MSTKKFNLGGSFTETTLHLDESEKKIHVENKQDVQAILDKNKFEHNHKLWDFSGELKKANMKKIAEIDMITLDKLVKRGICTYAGKILEPAQFKRFLNDPDNKNLRIWRGRI